MVQAQAQTRCGFPGCPNERVAAPAGGGRPSAYCADPAHNAASAFRARRAVQQRDAGTDQDQPSERPASLAGLRLRTVADQVRDELAGHRDRLEGLVDAALESFDEAGDPAAVEAELASMRAEMTRAVGETEAALAGERRDRAAA